MEENMAKDMVDGIFVWDRNKECLNVELLELGFGENGENFMKNKKYDPNKDKPIGKVTNIPDFLPSPAEILASFQNQKVTLTLDYQSVEFFKAHARKAKKPYQRMMREVLRRYVQNHEQRG